MARARGSMLMINTPVGSSDGDPESISGQLGRRYLSPPTVAGILTTAFESYDPKVFLAVLNQIVSVWGWDRLARDSGIPKGRLRRALAPGARPRFKTMVRILSALGVRLTVSKPVG